MSAAQIVNQEEINNRCRICKIRTYSFCRCLKDDKLEVFSRISYEKNYKDKQNIFLQSDPSDYLFNITEGNVKIYQLLDDGRIQIIGFLYPGDFFGTYKNHKYNYSAEAIGNLKTCAFEQKTLDKFMDQNHVLAKELLNQTSYELTLAQDRMTVLGKLNAVERIAKFLINISNQRKRIGWQSNPISLSMTRQDIADYLGLTIETISREFTKLKTKNIIKIISSKQMFLNDVKKLEEIAK